MELLITPSYTIINGNQIDDIKRIDVELPNKTIVSIATLVDSYMKHEG